MRTATVLATAIIALVLWLALRDRTHAAPAKSPETPSAVIKRAPSTPLPPALHAADEDEHDPMPTVDATHTKMQAIGRQCFTSRTPRAVAPNEPDDTVGRLELRLVVRISSNTAHVDTAEVVTTRHLRDDLRDCIVTASRAATWSVDAPDGTQEIVELFRMGDFVAVPSPDSPPSAPPTK